MTISGRSNILITKYPTDMIEDVIIISAAKQDLMVSDEFWQSATYEEMEAKVKPPMTTVHGSGRSTSVR